MTKQLIAGMVAVTALSIIRSGDGRHVPGTPSADFEVDKKTAASLVASGAAAYADPEMAKQAAPEGGSDTGASSGAETGSTGQQADTSGAGGTLIAPLVAAALTETAADKAAAGNEKAATDTKPAAKTAAAPAAKTAAKKTATKKN